MSAVKPEDNVVPDYLRSGAGLQLGAQAMPINRAVALTYDGGKAPLATLPWAALDSMSRVQAYGHRKYGDFYNYRKGMEISRNLSCALRHIRDFVDGQDTDAESGESHLGHAMTRLAFVLQNIKDGVAVDDRYKRTAP